MFNSCLQNYGRLVSGLLHPDNLMGLWPHWNVSNEDDKV